MGGGGAPIGAKARGLASAAPRRAPMFPSMADLSLRAAFAEAARRYADQIDGALGAGDVPSLRRIAHRLKGSAAMHGHPGLSRAAAALEAALTRAKDTMSVKDPGDIAESARELARLCERAASPGA